MAKERYDIGSDVDMCGNTLYNAKIDGTSCVVPKDSNSHTHDNRVALDKVSGENTGDETTARVLSLLGGSVTGYISPIYLPDLRDVRYGYYFGSDFYLDAGHVNKIPSSVDKLYIDLNTGVGYYYHGGSYRVLTTYLPFSSVVEGKAGVVQDKVVSPYVVKESVMYGLGDVNGYSFPLLNTTSKTIVNAINEISNIADDARSIALGATKSFVFDTEADMEDWLDDPLNVDYLEVGNYLLIRELSVPDYWWDGTKALELEVKIDLTNYYNKTEVYTKSETTNLIDNVLGDINTVLENILDIKEEGGGE